MKIIKFRAWNKKKKQMFDVMSIDFEDIGQIVKDYQNVTHYLDKVVLMQYTGLKDKNGKEIYEGDIVKYQGLESFDYKDLSEEVQQVEFIHGAFHPIYLSERNFHTSDDEMIVVKDIEVIGNIYENPNLLKTKNPQSYEKQKRQVNKV